jgi:hypothetical protein
MLTRAYGPCGCWDDTTTCTSPSGIDGAGHCGKIAHSEESFGFRGSFGADWSFRITLEDLRPPPRYFLPASMTSVMLFTAVRVTTEDK